MIFSCERTKLLDAVSRLQRVVSSKTSMPVLEGILISAEQGKVTLISYNLEMGMKKEIYAKCDETGDIVINARLLADILRRMNVEISADSRLNCHIKSGEATFDIMGMAATDFPEMPSLPESSAISISGDVMSDMVKGTIFAAAQTEGAKPILTGINISISNGILQFVAIDGYRLAIRKEKINIDKEINFTVSNKAIGEAVKLIDEDTENVEINVGERLISFNISGYSFISRLLEGEFVNYNKALQTEIKQKVVVNTRDLIIIKQSIIDNKEDIEKVTQKFYKGKGSKRGSGIGLALVKEIISAHGGEFIVESEYGVFTRMTFTLHTIRSMKGK